MSLFALTVRVFAAVLAVFYGAWLALGVRVLPALVHPPLVAAVPHPHVLKLGQVQ